MASTADANYGFDSSKLQSATAPPPVIGAGAGAANNNNAYAETQGANTAGVGPGYGGYAESTGLFTSANRNNANNNAAVPSASATTTGAATGRTAPPPPPPAPATTAGTGGTYAGTGAGASGAGGAAGGTTSAKAKTYATRAYDRFIKPGGRAGAAEKEWDIPLAILAVFVPPLAVFFKVGLINIDFVINVCLTILAWFPGVLHAWYVIFIQRGAKRSGTPVDSTAYNAAQRDKTL